MRCKYCKNKFEKLHFLQKWCLKPECIKKAKDDHWKKVTKPKLKKELLSVKDYLKIAQKIFNEYIRLRDKDKNCISCNAKAGTYTMSAGHYIPSTNKSVTFNEYNVNGQCWYNCNSKKSGNLIQYRKGLIKKIGLEEVEKLEQIGRETKHFTIDELKQIIETYKEKKKQLLTKK